MTNKSLRICLDSKLDMGKQWIRCMLAGNNIMNLGDVLVDLY